MKAALPEISRRTVLKWGGAALAASTMPQAAFALGRMPAGEGELVIVSDGFMQLPLAGAYPSAPDGAVLEMLSTNDLPTNALTPDCNVTFLKHGDRLIVFDVGAGSNFLSTTGKLLDNLAEAGLDPQDVTDVIFTHAHPDHLWGLTDDFDELVFPNADYRMSRAEWDFWAAPDALDKMPEDRKTFVVGAQNRFAAIEDQIIFFEPGDEVAPSVEAVDTAGHTPGHVSFLVHGGDTPVLVAGDALAHPIISFAKPDWRAASDQDQEKAAKARVSLLDRLAGDKARIIGFHFPHPAGGMVERKDGAYRFVPA